LVTSLSVTAISRLTPDDYANTAVGITFLGVTWFVALRGDTPTIAAYGLSLGGITEPVRLEFRRLMRGTLSALAWSLGLALIFFRPFGSVSGGGTAPAGSSRWRSRMVTPAT
jgi:hypothetical protein